MKKKNSLPASYLNEKQLALISSPQKDRTWIGGRGTGKTHVIGASTYHKACNIPRAKIFFSSSTYQQILTKTLPAVENMWHSIGLKEYKDKLNPGHYIVGRKPPRQWDIPYNRPFNYKNAITFFNGFTIELLSMDRPDLARGGSYDGGEIDEAALVPEDALNTVLIPSIRANSHRFNHWCHQQLSKYTSMPWKSSGLYLLDYKEKSDLYPDKFFYLESTTHDNLLVLGDDYISRMKDVLPYSTYMVEIMNHRSVRGEHNFYYAFDDNKHTYMPRFAYRDDEYRGIAVEGMKDRHRNRPIDLSFDMSGWFKGCTAYQSNKGVENMIHSFSVPASKGLRDLVNKICDTFSDQEAKTVEIYGEPRGHNRSQELGGTSYDVIRKSFEDRGWNVIINVTNNQVWLHDKRYEFVNEILMEGNSRLPKLRINQETCKDVIIAINNTDVTPDFKKVKSDEKNRSFNQNHATHFTDTIDYFLEQKYGWVVSHNFRGSRIMTVDF